jgi:DNA-directed RNA polymerase specialized sigma24 family protein
MFGIARYVLLEKIRKDQRLEQFDDQTPTPLDRADPFAELWQKEVDKCMRQCWQALAPEDRETYGSFNKKRAKADERDHEREQLAKRLGISLAALRTRVQRIRTRLIECVR